MNRRRARGTTWAYRRFPERADYIGAWEGLVEFDAVLPSDLVGLAEPDPSDAECMNTLPLPDSESLF